MEPQLGDIIKCIEGVAAGCSVINHLPLGNVFDGATFLAVLVAAFQLLLGRRQARRQQNIDSINKVTQLYEMFYNINNISAKDRLEFEYEFYRKWAPPMEKWLVYPELLTDEEKNYLVRIDSFLNFFEHLSYVSNEMSRTRKIMSYIFFFLPIGMYERLFGFGLLSARDRESMFNFWLDVVMKDNDHVLLRRYLLQGFERLAERLRFRPFPVYVATYGTLRPGAVEQLVGSDPAARAARDAIGQSRHVGTCLIPGNLYVGHDESYPAIRDPHDDPVEPDCTVGDLYELAPDGAAAKAKLRALDRYEEFDPADRWNSLYVRRFVNVKVSRELIGGGRAKGGKDDFASVGAWVYFARSSHGLTPTNANDWLAYAKAKARAS